MLLIIILIAAIIAAVALLNHLKRETDRQTKLTTRFRASETYGRIYQILSECNPELVEEILVRPTELVIRLLPPDGRNLRYRFDRSGGEPLSSALTFSLAQAIAVDLPGLGDKKKYYFKEHREKRTEWGNQPWYSYTIHSDRKELIIKNQQARANGSDHV